MVSASSSASSPLSEKDLPPLFLLRRLFRFLLGSLFLGLRFCCLFLLGRFLLRRFLGRFLPRWLGCRFWRGSLFLGFFADDHQLLFLGFDDLFGFARQLLVVFQPGQLVVVFEIVLLDFHSILPWGNLRSEEHTSELQSHHDLVCRLLLEKKKKKNIYIICNNNI